ncbi:type II restriction endonuclease [Pseudarthrobacter sp. C1]|uniref:type II restriction endonuclease n=1 Tax=Pseudarthrobacter sp. C1 TaxID=3108940 RepID=UPI002B0532DF|nr:type II restriction endonuclease [Pseudarthrobacter sp. C1]MEA3549242.1 type II restriction endonuclease [Pseudarthrobacter sp. C1]
MDFSNLADHFEGVAAKVLSTVETVGRSSNQHELDGVKALQSLFGRPAKKLSIPTRFFHVSDEMEEPVAEDGSLTYYDARINTPNRSEYRLYYPASVDAMKMAQAGDVVFIAKRKDGSALFIVAPGNSTVAAQLDWLFGTAVLEHSGFSVRSGMEADRLPLTAMYLLDTLGVSLEPLNDDWLNLVLDRFGPRFPTSAEFGAFARSTLPELRPNDDPDGVLMAWLEREELLFRTLERHLAADTLENLYSEGRVDLDRFIEVSLSLHNRRKSRAGRSLENHLIALFAAMDLRHSFNPMTEQRIRPDFIFPSIDEYRNPRFPDGDLTMLGVKTSCKDRWRQVLSEANRVPEKHLLTLESPISVAQTDEMRDHRIQLVIPRPLHEPFKPQQQHFLMSLADFAALARERERRGPTQLALL